MKTNYLLPNKYKNIGWFIFLSSFIIGLLFYRKILDGQLLQTNVLTIYNNDSLAENKIGFFKIIANGIFDELIALMIIIGGLIVGFTEEKIEDEFSYQLRKESLVWAIIFNYSILLLAIIFIYNMTFLEVLIINMFTPLLFFIIRFNFLKYKNQNYDE